MGFHLFTSYHPTDKEAGLLSRPNFFVPSWKLEVAKEVQVPLSISLSCIRVGNVPEGDKRGGLSVGLDGSISVTYSQCSELVRFGDDMRGEPNLRQLKKESIKKEYK